MQFKIIVCARKNGRGRGEGGGGEVIDKWWASLLPHERTCTVVIAVCQYVCLCVCGHQNEQIE